ncbi:Phosphatidylcholine:ceramide cholinephosphotransferase 1 [Aphelenchoides avenae]|nr:Phosphatidylcholine:ceramide cholinephosphotransferase 1 [Aphelenchus avenae]
MTPPLDVEAGTATTTVIQRPTTSSSNSDDSEESYLDSLEEGRAPLLDDEVSHYSGNGRVYPKRSAHKIPKERYKTGVALVLLAAAGTCNDLVLSYIHEKVPETAPLPDVVFSNVPYWQWGLEASEYIMLTSVACLFTLVFFHKHRWVVLRRVATIASLLYFGRCITMFVTQVPVADTNYYCSPKLPPDERTVWNIVVRGLRVLVGLGLKLNGKHSLCGDYIYSGHTVVLVISYLFISEYSPRHWRFLHFLSFLGAVTGVAFLLASRGHYTIDVILSYWITTQIFWSYHTFADVPTLRDTRREHNHLSNVIWYRLFLFMEGSVNRPVPHRYDLPFPWKKYRPTRACVASDEVNFMLLSCIVVQEAASVPVNRRRHLPHSKDPYSKKKKLLVDAVMLIQIWDNNTCKKDKRIGGYCLPLLGFEDVQMDPTVTGTPSAQGEGVLLLELLHQLVPMLL